jgi:hypothetical protein
MYDERYGDIHFEEEDPQSEFYNPKCIRDVYLDLINGVFDQPADEYYEDVNEEEEEDDVYEYDESYYDADNEFNDC